ncbi:hypothetical protein C8Q76DRAFT_354922 [Earliella scabrosa]|nr:hypothetical protein C8Q76DRAFT_354922 [Earliella scabrosa]
MSPTRQGAIVYSYAPPTINSSTSIVPKHACFVRTTLPVPNSNGVGPGDSTTLGARCRIPVRRPVLRTTSSELSRISTAFRISPHAESFQHAVNASDAWRSLPPSLHLSIQPVTSFLLRWPPLKSLPPARFQMARIDVGRWRTASRSSGHRTLNLASGDTPRTPRSRHPTQAAHRHGWRFHRAVSPSPLSIPSQVGGTRSQSYALHAEPCARERPQGSHKSRSFTLSSEQSGKPCTLFCGGLPVQHVGSGADYPF